MRIEELLCAAIAMFVPATTLADPCGELRLHSDGTWENGYAWSDSYSPPPDYGAFAECYSGVGEICTLVYWVTDIGFHYGGVFDAFVWQDDGTGQPGNVLCTRVAIDPGTIPEWPAVRQLDVALENCCVSGNWWVGFRGTWGLPAFWVLADTNGPNQGCPMTKIRPGVTWPEGWQDVSVIYPEETKSLGIGAYLRPCAPVAAERASWGRVKALYAR